MSTPEKPLIVEKLGMAIKDGDRVNSAKLLTEMQEELRTDKMLVKWLVTPKNLTEVQNSIIETFEIPRKAMMVRRKTHNQSLNALNFAKAMQIAVQRTIPNE